MEAVLGGNGRGAAGGPATPGSNVKARGRNAAKAERNIREGDGQGFTPEAVAKLAALRGDKPPFSDRAPFNGPDTDFDLCYEFLPGVLAEKTRDPYLVAITFSISAYLIPPENGERGLVVVNSFVPDYGNGDDVHTRAAQVDAQMAELLAAYRENGEGKMLTF